MAGRVGAELDQVARLVVARVARSAAVQVERAEAIVRGHELRAAALRKVIERRLRQGEANDARLEQKESDDRAVRASWNRLTAPGSARL